MINQPRRNSPSSICLDALNTYHRQNAASNEQAPQLTCSCHATLKESQRNSCAVCIAYKFADQASQVLSPQKLNQLVEFLTSRKAPAPDIKQLRASKEAKVREFYLAETKISGNNDERLAACSGPEDASLGLILHVQSEDDAIGAFWDKRSATIGLIEDKGLSPEFTFGYDWHWRADYLFSSSRQSGCPATQWGHEVRALHDQMSADILQMLPLPVVLTGSSCTRENIRKRYKQSLISIDFPLEKEIAPYSATLRIDIDYTSSGVRRIFCHVHHPSSGFFATRDVRKSMSLQIDAGMNFCLWLVGRPYHVDTFDCHYKYAASRAKKAAPLPEMWAYVRKEKEEKRTLKLGDYSSSFISWAYRFLEGSSPKLILETGQSLAGVIANEIRRRLRYAALERKRSAEKTVPLVGELEIAAPVDEILTDIRHNVLTHGKHLDETKVNSATAQPRTNELLRKIDSLAMETLHNSPVTVMRPGTIKLQTTSLHCLSFRLSGQAAKAILELRKTPRIHFSPIIISIRVDGDDVYQKPIERLLASAEGPAWFSQILHEINVKEDVLMKTADELQQHIFRIDDVRHNPSMGSTWKNGELRRKLREGGYFHCGKANIQGKVYGRLSFKSIQIWIPDEADMKPVWVRCFLVPEGTHHPSQCCTSGLDTDPCRRLGIQIRFTIASGSSVKEEWVILNGDKSAKKLNSLVDFLENRDDGWTEAQPRRFLDRNLSRRRHKVTYSDD